MINSEKIYTFLCVLFASTIIMGNLIYQKFVHLPLYFHIFEISVGIILYPFTFMITDLIAEFYGKEKASFCVTAAMITNILVAFNISMMDNLNATEWSKIDNETFNKVFGLCGAGFLASIFGCFISQQIDIKIYMFLKRITKDKMLWLRNGVSTSISLFIDTSIVIFTLAQFNAFPNSRIFPLILNSYSFKLTFTIISIPLFYFLVFAIKKIIQK